MDKGNRFLKKEKNMVKKMKENEKEIMLNLNGLVRFRRNLRKFPYIR